MSKKTKSTVASGLILGAIAHAALAQTTPAPVSTPPSSGALGEVTITANKREERLQDVPATATVVPYRQLEQQNITTVEELTRAVPSFGATAGGFSIRGSGGVS